MIVCDLCGETKECFQKEIDGKEFDICADCWRPLEEKLRGKGRVNKSRETVLLPPRTIPERKPEEQEPLPGRPPTIFGETERAKARVLSFAGELPVISWHRVS